MQRPDDFQAFVAQERERLDQQRQEILAQKAELDTKLQGIDREMAAITAYEQAKAGKSPTGSHQQLGRQKGRRSGRRQEVIELIKGASEGLTRREILERLGAKGDRSNEQSVSNALSALKKAGQLNQENGRYIAA